MGFEVARMVTALLLFLPVLSFFVAGIFGLAVAFFGIAGFLMTAVVAFLVVGVRTFAIGFADVAFLAIFAFIVFGALEKVFVALGSSALAIRKSSFFPFLIAAASQLGALPWPVHVLPVFGSIYFGGLAGFAGFVLALLFFDVFSNEPLNRSSAVRSYSAIWLLIPWITFATSIFLSSVAFFSRSAI